MKHNLLRILLVLASLRSAAALDLTPAISEYTAEGITFRQLNFQDGKRKIVYEPPRLWTCRGGASSLRLAPPNVDRADAIIQVGAVKVPPTLDQKAIDALREQSLRGVPPGSVGALVVSEEQNPVSLENSASYGVTLSYSALGETFVRNIVYVSLPETQLTFQVTARKAEFDSVLRPFRSSIYSWHWVDPTPAAKGQTVVSN